MKKIQFAKPCVELNKFEMEEIYKICHSGQFCEGKYVEQVEDYFRTTCNVKYAISCSSATQGLVIALKAADIVNKTVALPAFTWPSTLYALGCNNCTPYFCDININTWNILPPPEFVIKDRVIASEIEAIIPVDVFGNDSYINDDRPVIYDAAHGFGLSKLGQRGLAEVVSFSFTKPVTGMQGGIILTNNEKLYEDANELRRLSAKMCEINALILMNEIKRKDEKLFERIRLIELYRYYLDVPFTEQVVECDSNYSTYSILLEIEKRDRVVKAFKENNVEVKVYYDPLISGLTNTDFIYNRILSLPIYSKIEDEIPRICKIINES